MIQITQDTLNTIPEGAVVAFFTQGGHRVHSNVYPIIDRFDGKLCDFSFPSGGGYFTAIPISEEDSKFDYRGLKAATLTIMDGWVEYEITDDWGNNHYLYIRSSQSELILKSIRSYKNNYGIVATLK